MKKGFWCKLLLCTLMLILSAVLMTGCAASGCSTPEQEETQKPPKNVTLVVDGVEYDQLQTGDQMPEPPQKDGYDFAGWYDNNDKKVDKIPSSADKDLTLTGKWTPVEYTVTFENTKDAANENATSFTIESGTITLLPLEKDGYTFDGWFLGGVKIEQILTGTTGNLTLAAKWTPITYDITFEGITGATNTNPDSFTVEDGKIQLSTPERPGYNFDGWYAGSDLVTEIDASAAQSVTVRAEWTPIVFDIIFENTKDAENANELNFTVESGNIYLSGLEMDGYRFLGWYANNVPVEFIPAGTIGSVTLTAAWETVRYDIVFEGTKGAENPNDTFFTVEDDKVTLQPLEKEGYTFDGWYINNILVTEFDVDVLGTVIITAKWTPHTYDIVFENTKGQPNSNPVQFTPDTNTITLLPLDDKDGYRFDGWYAGNVRVETIPTGTVGTVNLTAVWKPIRYDIVFENTKGAENLNVDGFTVEDSVITLLPLEKEGYIFNGWYVDNLPVTTINTNVLGTVTLTAKWTPLTYDIIFENTKDAENGNRTQFTPDDETFELLPLEKEGYTFLGWYVGENKVDYVYIGTVGDLVLEARWELTVYHITYEGMEGVDFDPENATDYTVESGIVELYNPTKEGYSFDGWYLGGVKVEAIPEGSTGDLTITARWSVVTYTVTLENTKGATDKTELSYTLFKGVKLPTLTLEGYTFEGWLDENGDAITEITLGTTGDMTVTAKWTATVYNITYENVGENTNNNPLTYTTENEIVLEDLPNGDGVTFAGWLLDGIPVDVIPAGTTGNITLVADWRIPVYTIEDLQSMTNLEGSYMLMNDLDLEGMEWTPIGTTVTPFVGNFSGGGHTISNFKITESAHEYFGLFGYVKGSISDLTVEGFEITLTATSYNYSTYVGGIVGFMDNGNVINCSASGVINVNSNGSYPNYVCVGGIAGSAQNLGTVKGCYVDCDIYVQKASSYAYLGGMFGTINESTASFYDCAVYADITVDAYATAYAGGLFGYGTNTVTVKNCSAVGAFDLYPPMEYGRVTRAGGLVGSNDAIITIEDCTSAVDIDVWGYAGTEVGGVIGGASGGASGAGVRVTNTTYAGTIHVCNNNDSYYDSYVGGIAGLLNGEITGCYADAEIHVKNAGNAGYSGGNMVNVGGILGYGQKSAVKDSSVDVTITFENSALKYAGGIGGWIEKIENCHANVTITSDRSGRQYAAVGGLAGLADYVSDSYATVDIYGWTDYVGGLVGSLGDEYTNGKMSNCYATGTVSGIEYVGGLVGGAHGARITGCWADVTVEATNSGDYESVYVGGLVGSASNTYLDKCYAYADITADQGARQIYAGGLVGYNGTISNSYAIGSIYAVSYSSSTYNNPAYINAGGIVGTGTAVSNCYASVDITALKRSQSGSYNNVYVGYISGGSFPASATNSYYNEGMVIQHGYETDEVLTVGFTTGSGVVTPISPDSFKDRAWGAENLWSFEIDYWLFDGVNYPTFNEDFIANGYVEIHTAEDLLALSGKNLTLNYKLMTDIDLEYAEWLPIASVGGIFDGNGYTISNFTMTSGDYSTYGFICTNAGTVRGLLLKNFSLSGSNYDTLLTIGALVGYNQGKIENCGVTVGSVSFYSKSTSNYYSYYLYIGGLVGQNDGLISGCFSAVSVSTSRNYFNVYIGGLVGYNPNGTILNSYATGGVSGSLDSSLARGKASVSAGGLVGRFEEGRMEYCYATGNVYASGASAYSGGLIGVCGYNELDGTHLFACNERVTTSSSYYTNADSFADNAPSNLPETYYYLSGMYMSSSKGEKTYTGKARTKSEMIQIMAENWDSSVWSFSETDYPTLSFFAN